MVKVKFLPSAQEVEIPAGSSILQAAIAAGVQVESTCGGKGTCGKCQVQLLNGKISSPTLIERRFLSEAQLASGWVLACQRTLDADSIFKLREQKDVYERKVGISAEVGTVPAEPSVHKYPLTLPEPSVEDQRPDWERILSLLPSTEIRFSRSVAVSLPRILRNSNFQVTAVVDGDSLLIVEPGDTHSCCYGLAVDIGTTTVVAHLVDLNEGKVIKSGAVTNPQNVYGADVIARITHAAGSQEGLQQLQEKVIGGLNAIIEELCQATEIGREEIYQAVVVGNTTMSHLFLGIDPTYLAPAPFVPVFRQLVEVNAWELGLNILTAGKVTVLPNVAGYVGSDTVGVMLAAEVDRLQGINLIVDIGTNGEIILVGRNRILTCSTAAGPAFEGAEINCGMRAAEGAIEGVCIASDIELTVIAGGKPMGVCGSGLIDAVAQMFKAGVIASSGRLAGTAEELEKLPPSVRKRLRRGSQGMEFVLVWGRDSFSGEDVVLSQKDVRELQLAKGAILTGIRILMKELGVGSEEINQVLLAGAFGCYIKKESALAIGLLPLVPLERIATIGNAAGEGAKKALLWAEERSRAVELSRGAEHIELSARSDFQEEFLQALAFGEAMRTK